MDDAVDAIERRLGEGRKHLLALDAAVERFIRKPKPYTHRVQFDPKRSRVVLRAVDVEPVPPEFAILIGECVYQLRAALDNLVYALAERHTVPLPDKIAKKASFPICKSGPRFREVAEPKLAGVDSRAAAVIERLQPYHRRKKPSAVALRQLEELRNVDQHRLLHPVALARDVSRCRLLAPQGTIEPTDKFRFGNRPIKENAMLAWFEIVPKGDVEVYVEDNASIDIAFERGSPARSVQGKSVVTTLSQIALYVGEDVLPALLPFLA